jgi:hypothetical protein
MFSDVQPVCFVGLALEHGRLLPFLMELLGRLITAWGVSKRTSLGLGSSDLSVGQPTGLSGGSFRISSLDPELTGLSSVEGPTIASGSRSRTPTTAKPTSDRLVDSTALGGTNILALIAPLVAMVKAMENDGEHGRFVRQLLRQYPMWETFKV